jgi:uncharacterized membrane protein
VIQCAIWLLFLAFIPFKRKWSNILCTIALKMGLARQFGVPSMTPEYLREAMYEENLLSLPYIGICMMVGS